ncbi:MAG TPA: hypothetical protein ENI80_01180 [Acidiferrobacteraceae bacterium]|nr:hypothetical protein [Acidiferrobacteraceae bacterium]
MRKTLVILICLGLWASTVVGQAQVLNTDDSPQVLGAENANPPTLQLPSNPPVGGGNTDTGNAQGATILQGPSVTSTVNLAPPTPTLAPEKAQAPQGKSIKKGAVRPDTKKLESEPGLRGGMPGVGGQDLNAMRKGGSLLNGGIPGGLPGASGSPGNLGGKVGGSSLPGLTGRPSPPGVPKTLSVMPGLPGLGKTKTISSSKGSQLPGLPGTGQTGGLPGAQGGAAGIPKGAAPDPSSPFGSRVRGITGTPGLGGGQGSSPSVAGIGGNSEIMADGKKDKKKNKKNKKNKGKSKGRKKRKVIKFGTKDKAALDRLIVKYEKKVLNNTATEKDVRVYLTLLDMKKGFSAKKKPKKGSIWSPVKQNCNPNDPSCKFDSRSDEEILAEIRQMIDRGGIPGEGDTMKPVQDDGTTGRGGKVLGSSVISRPTKDSLDGKSGGGRIVTDLEKTGNPGAAGD